MIEITKQVTQKILDLLHIYVKDIQCFEKDGIIYVYIKAQNDGPLLIGQYGETLQDLQELIKGIVSKDITESYVLHVDVDEYKIQQEKNMIDFVEKKAKKVIETKKTEILPPMTPYQRRLVHTYFSENQNFTFPYKNIKTESIGEGDDRRIQLIYQE